jgi:hypothetical protein
MNVLFEFLRDLRFGARLLRRSPGFTSIAVLSLGLGIGGATAVFSLVNAIVLRTLPVPDPQQLFQARSQSPGREYGDLFSGPTFEHSRDELSARGAAELFAATSVAGMQLQPDGDAAGARGTVQLVSGEYFTALRQQAQLGRLLAPSDNRAVGAHPVAVISDSFWRRRFATAPDAVGRPLAINGTSFTVIGVTRPRFFGTTLALRAPDVWIPYMMQPVVRYSQNASNSNSADPRKPWPPQPEMAWLNVFARVPARGEGTVDAMMTTVFRRDNEAVLAADATADDRAAISKQRVTLSDVSTGLSPCATRRRSRSMSCSRWWRRCWRSAAATWPACCCRARRDGPAKWPSASRSAPAACAWCASCWRRARCSPWRAAWSASGSRCGPATRCSPSWSTSGSRRRSISTPRSTGVCSAFRWPFRR